MHLDVPGDDSFLEVYSAPAQRHQTTDLAFLSTGDENVKGADVPTHHVLDQFQQDLSFSAFVKGVNDDVCSSGFSNDGHERRHEITCVGTTVIGLARRTQPVQCFRDVGGLVQELCDYRAEEALTLLFLPVLEIEVKVGYRGSRTVIAELQDVLDDGRTEDQS